MPVSIDHGLFCRCERYAPALAPNLIPPIIDLEMIQRDDGFAIRAICGRCGKVGAIDKPFMPDKPHIPDEPG